MHTKFALSVRTGFAAAALFVFASCATTPKEKSAPAGAVESAPLSHTVWSGTPSGAGELVLNFINVGQGDCTLVEFPNGKRLLIDCGSTDGPFDATRVRNAIKARLNPSDPTIDLLVITHPDEDHYNKLAEVLGPATAPKIKVSKILYNGATTEYPKASTKAWLDAFPVSRRIVITDQSYNTYPARDLPGIPGAVILAANVTATTSAKNARSVVIKITHGTFDAMITGDATSATDRKILDLYPDAKSIFLDVEVWKAAHHGAWATATQTDLWANAVLPETVIYSCSSTNGYGHPNIHLAEKFASHTRAELDHTITFFTGMNARASTTQNQPYRTESMYSTANSGTIVVRSDGTTWTTTLEHN